MDTVITTLIKRPYVFAFLSGFLYLAIRHMGLVRTVVWLVTGYFIAFFSEWSSIHNGIPYGEYHYIYENLRGEFLLAGVPVWDSLSYVFMSYAGLGMARFIFPGGRLWIITLLGAFFTTLLDIITDPVAVLGEKWFLGEVFYYAHPGWYFGVPWTNFAGWFLVSATIIGVNLLLFRRRQSVKKPSRLHPLFFISIGLFNIAIAFAIKAHGLGIANTVLMIFCCAVIWKLWRRTHQSQS